MNSVLLEVYGTMTRIEKETLKSFYIAKGPNSVIANALILFMENNDNATDDEVAVSVYGNLGVEGSMKSKYSRVKRRLLNDMLTVLARSMDIRTYSSPLAFRRSEVREMLRNVDVLLLKGLEDMAIKELKRAERLGCRFELYNELVVIYDLLLQLVGFRTSEEEYSQLYAKLDTASHEAWSGIRAKDLFMRITRPGYFKKSVNYDVIQLLSQLQELADESSSAIVKGYLYRAHSFIAFQELNNDSSLRYGQMYFDLVNAEPALRSNDNLGGAHMMQGTVYNSMGNHASAFEAAQNASRLFSNSSTNKFRALDLAFISAVNSLNLIQAESTLEELKRYRHRRAPGKIKETILYKELFFNVLFGRYSEANEIIVSGDYSRLGKSSYSIGYKIMELFVLLFTADVDQIEYRVLNVRRSEREYLRTDHFARERILVDHLHTSVKELQGTRDSLNRSALIRSMIQILKTKGSGFTRQEHEITDYSLILNSHLDREIGESILEAR